MNKSEKNQLNKEDESLQEKERLLLSYLQYHQPAALAFSGGVDSAYLLKFAQKHQVDVQPYFVYSAFQPTFELRDARRVCAEIDVELKVITLDILANPKISKNNARRCYYCKTEILRSIKRQVEVDGYMYLFDGTNASDQTSDRPGMQAVQEMGVQSPLRVCGFSKKMIRTASFNLGLFTAKKPAYACLATRIPVGVEITKDLLLKIEKAETYLFLLGFRDFRVRLLVTTTGKNIAKIEVTRKQLPIVLEKGRQIKQALKKDFQEVVLDLDSRQESC